MFLGVLFVLAILSVPLSGGRLPALAELRLRGAPLIGLALAVQVVIISIVPGGDGALHQAIHLGTYALAAGFAWLNRRIPGLALAAAGGACNLAAIAANGGVMPASASAIRAAGLVQDTDGFLNSAPVEHARLAFLGDVFAAPASWPVSNVFSVGDVLLVAGVLTGLHVICGTAVARRLGRHAVAVRGVEVVDTGTSQALVRVRTVAHRGMAPGDLVLHDGPWTRQLPPLPGSTHVAGYGVPAELLARGGARLSLALPNRALVDLTARLGDASTSLAGACSPRLRRPMTTVPPEGIPGDLSRHQGGTDASEADPNAHRRRRAGRVRGGPRGRGQVELTG